MKQFLPVVWWLTATLVIAFVLVGLGYLFADALLLGVLFLPGMLTARYFVPQLSFENRRQGILDTVYLALAILGIEYLSLMLGHAVVLGAGEGGNLRVDGALADAGRIASRRPVAYDVAHVLARGQVARHSFLDAALPGVGHAHAD